MVRPIYLDQHIISRPSLAVIQNLNESYQTQWGIIGAAHHPIQNLQFELQQALRTIYHYLDAPSEYAFQLNSTGEELVFQFLMHFYLDTIRATGKNHILVSSTEEASILIPLSYLKKVGCVHQDLPIDSAGRIDVASLEACLKPKTVLLSLSGVNALTGVIQPLEQILEICHHKKVAVHVNASQMIGKYFSLKSIPIDFLSFEGDKIHTPKNISGFFSLKKLPLKQSNTTICVAHIKALALAIQSQVENQDLFMMETARLRDLFEQELRSALPDSVILFQDVPRMPHITVVCFPGIMSESLLYCLSQKGLYASIGGGNVQILPHLLKQYGLPENFCNTAMSFSLSNEITQDMLADAVDIIVSSVRSLKTMSRHL